MKVQQFSGPVMAKGVEDTAFYRYNRFVALNEVGGAPERFGLAPALFHKANAARAQNWPHAMLATATHDTKRGEDNRARLAVLSEMPEEWRRQVEPGAGILRARRGDVEGSAPPDRDDEYMLYQMFVGSWPIDMLDAPSDEQLEAYGVRIQAALEKSLREAQAPLELGRARRSNTRQATQAFAKEALRSGDVPRELPAVHRGASRGSAIRTASFKPSASSPRPACPTSIRAANCGTSALSIPTIAARSISRSGSGAARSRRASRGARERAALFATLMEDWQDGRIKLATTALLLALRREQPELFAERRLSADRHRGRATSDWAFGYVRAVGRPKARRRCGALSRASRGGAAIGTRRRNCRKARWFDLFRGADADPPRRCTRG